MAPGDAAAVDAPTDLDVEAYRSAIRAFGDVAEAVAAETDLNTLLHLVASRICQLCDIRRCSVYLRDEETGLFRGQVGHQAGRNIDAAIKRLVAGTLADRFTQEIVQTKQPVLVQDAVHDPRPIRAAMREWDVRDMLGVPMLASNEVVGICYLDNEDEPHAFTPNQVEVAATFANLAAIAIVQAQLSEKRRVSLETVARQNELLLRARQIDERLTRLVLEDANLTKIAAAVGELTGKPCVLYDAAYRRLASDAPAGQRGPVTLFDDGRHALPPIVSELAGLTDKRAGVLGPFSTEGLNHRFLVAPIVVRGDLWGYLVLVEHAHRFGPLDPVIASRAATIIALELAAARRAATARGEALESLAIDLVRGLDDADRVEQRATYLGVRLTGAHVVALISGSGSDPSPSARSVLEAFKASDPALQVLPTAVAEGVVAIIEVPADAVTSTVVADVKATLADVCGRLTGGQCIAGLSTVCRSTSDIPRAYGEARQVVTLVESFAPKGEPPILSVDDLGVGRLLLTSSDRGEADRYVRDMLGALIETEDAHVADLLTTLKYFFDHSCSIRRTAHELDVHENTVRYRFARIKELTGLDVLASAEDQLAVQLALLVLKLEGRTAIGPASTA